MKYLKSIYSLILESVKPYKFEYLGKIGGIYNYSFFDEFRNSFRVEINIVSDGEVEIIYTSGDSDWKFSEIKTNIWRVTETVLGHILKDFIKNNDWCNSIIIKGLARETERSAISIRTKMYWRYLINNKPNGWELDRYGNEIYLLKEFNIQ